MFQGRQFRQIRTINVCFEFDDVGTNFGQQREVRFGLSDDFEVRVIKVFQRKSFSGGLFTDCAQNRKEGLTPTESLQFGKGEHRVGESVGGDTGRADEGDGLQVFAAFDQSGHSAVAKTVTLDDLQVLKKRAGPSDCDEGFVADGVVKSERNDAAEAVGQADLKFDVAHPKGRRRGEDENLFALKFVARFQKFALAMFVEELEIEDLDSRVEKQSRESDRDQHAVAQDAVVFRFGVPRVIDEFHMPGGQNCGQVIDDFDRQLSENEVSDD